MGSPAIPVLGKSAGDLAARLFAIVVVVADSRLLGPALSNRVYVFASPEMVVLTGLLASLILSDGNSAAHGLALRPREGWRPWIRFSLLAGSLILLLGLVCAAVWWVLGWPLPLPRKNPAAWPEMLYWMCLYAPVQEEIVYRILLTIALLPLLGDRLMVIASGLLFGAIHIRGGNPGPDNLIAGFFLQWAYLRSGTILVPLAMHSAGNAIALSSHLVNWSLQAGSP